MRTAIPLTVLVTGLACSLFTAPAQARARVFVASYGNDSNPCTFGSPCKTFQQAVNVVDPGGEVTAIDSAGFGPISINKAITITSPPGVEAGIVPVAGGNAIDISAGSTDAIVLRGLTLDGSGVAHNGIVFNSGGGLTVNNCVVQNFAWDGSNTLTGNGIMIVPTSGAVNFVITNTFASKNGNVGIYYLPLSSASSANGVIDHVVATANQYGMSINTYNATGGSAVTAVSNSIASNNTVHGIYIQNGAGTLAVSIDSTNISGNASYGIEAVNTPNVNLGRSTITANSIGIVVDTFSDTFNSYQDNHINGNGQDVYGSLNLYASK